MGIANKKVPLYAPQISDKVFFASRKPQNTVCDRPKPINLGAKMLTVTIWELRLNLSVNLTQCQTVKSNPNKKAYNIVIEQKIMSWGLGGK